MIDLSEITVRACPICKRGNVRILATMGIYGAEHDASISCYELECGHRVAKSLVDQEELPKFVRWYPEESE